MYYDSEPKKYLNKKFLVFFSSDNSGIAAYSPHTGLTHFIESSPQKFKYLFDLEFFDRADLEYALGLSGDAFLQAEADLISIGLVRTTVICS